MYVIANPDLSGEAILLMNKQSYVYIMTNFTNTVLYTGVTTNLSKRIYEHKHKSVKGFTSKYNINKLVYYEIHESVITAIEREKQIKGGSRKKKLSLIIAKNPHFDDLYGKIL